MCYNFYMVLSIFLILMLLFALLLLFVIFSAFLGFVITRVPFVPTYNSDVEFFVKELKISSSDVFYDLGSGDGKVIFLVNKLCGAKCVGYELTWWTHWLAKLKKRFLQPFSPFRGDVASASEVTERLQFKNQNFFKHPWTDANFIYAYLYPPLMGRVEEKFLADCRPGTIAIIRDFPFPNLQPVKVHFRPKRHGIYIYRKV